jgi:ATP-binding cassette subfamily B protein
VRNFWELLRLVFRLSLANSRTKTYTAIAFMFAGALALPLIAVALRFFVDAMLAGQQTTAAVAGTAVVLAWIAQLTFWHFGYRFYFDLLDLNTISFQEELIRLVNESPTIGHLERADFADRLEVVRGDTQQLYWSFSIVIGAFATALQIALTAAILTWLAPALLAVPVFAVPALIAGRFSQRIIDAKREQTAEPRRLSRHLLSVFTSSGAAKEIRGFGLQRYLPRRAGELWREVSAEEWRAEARGMAIDAAGQAVFGLAYVAALLFLVSRAISGHASIGDVLLVVALTGQINQQLSRALREVLALHRLSRTVERYRLLREQARPPATSPPQAPAASAPATSAPATSAPATSAPATSAPATSAPATSAPATSAPATSAPATGSVPPARLAHGIEFRGVGFTYPSATTPVLSGVDLLLPAGSIIGLVGENGSGKSTLLKLLAGLYQPSSGSILVDGTDLAAIDPRAWRLQISAAFQDYQRFELVAREAVGVGDLPRIGDEPAVAAALAQATDADLTGALPDGLATQLGNSYTNGHQLSGGQWQTVALARSMMRETPLVLILDEPTAALDAHAEYTLFERYAQQARRVAHRNGGLCVLVSHRFSTVRMADQIVVIDGGQIAELGSHDTLMQRDGLYATLYRLQAIGYR